MRGSHSGRLALCEHSEGYLDRFVVPGVLPGVECLVRESQKAGLCQWSRDSDGDLGQGNKRKGMDESGGTIMDDTSRNPKPA